MNGRIVAAITLAVGFLVTSCTAASSSVAPTAPAAPTASAAPTAPAASSSSVAPTSSTTTAPASPGLSAVGGFFAVSVADLPSSAAWYADKLGLTEAPQQPPANGATVVILRGAGLTVELIHQDAGVSLASVAPRLTDRTLLHGFVKAGVIVDDFDATVAWLHARSVPIAYGPFPATADQPANLIIADNEGNLIQFIAR
ncbi:MAG TPA: VOC family protein [Candidatus Limnocylindrales bacterium]|nr:VOC family protein [Candidatus Limnocylindrales bacterium]